MFEQLLIITPSDVEKFLKEMKTAEQELQDLRADLFEYKDMLADGEL